MRYWVIFGTVLICAVNSSFARTLISVEVKSTKGCKIIDYQNPEEERIKLKSLEWSGKCKGGYADGNGAYVATYENGSVRSVSGHFQQGKGEGSINVMESWPNGNKGTFDGFYKAGLPSGIGIASFTSASGEFEEYKGSFVAGLPHGYGTSKNSRRTYTGEYAEGKPNGRGKIEYKDGLVYDGQVRNGEPEGQGTLTNSSGSKLSGIFLSNSPPKSGRVEYTNGVTYEGELVELIKPNGRGKLTYTNGDSFIGEFANGKPVGEGTIEKKNGERLVVEVVDGKFKRKTTGQGVTTKPLPTPQAAGTYNSAAIDACKAKMYSIPATNFWEAMANANLCESNPNAWMSIKPPAQTITPQQSRTSCQWVGSVWTCASF